MLSPCSEFARSDEGHVVVVAFYSGPVKTPGSVTKLLRHASRKGQGVGYGVT